jgi:hypothetical protein
MMLAQLEGLQRDRLTRLLDQAVRGGHADQALHYAKQLAAASGAIPAEVGAFALINLVEAVERITGRGK